MKYQIGETRRVTVGRFDDGEDVLKGICEIAKKENIRAGVFYLLSGMKSGRFVVGPEREEIPPTPVRRELNESHEIVGLARFSGREMNQSYTSMGLIAKGIL